MHGFWGRAIDASPQSPKAGCAPSQDAQSAISREMSIAVDRLIFPRQVHGTEVRAVDRSYMQDRARDPHPICDGLVTRLRGLALCVRTADCAPVLLADAKAGVIGAAHCGWRGSLGGVLEACLAQMVLMGAQAERTRVAIGPAIGAAVYEVDSDFKGRFVRADASFADLFRPHATKRGHFFFDLKRKILRDALRLGVGCVEELSYCTLGDARFFSHRAGTLRKGVESGRQVSAIALRA